MIIARIEEMLYDKSVDDAVKKAIACVMSGVLCQELMRF